MRRKSGNVELDLVIGKDFLTKKHQQKQLHIRTETPATAVIGVFDSKQEMVLDYCPECRTDGHTKTRNIKEGDIYYKRKIY